jgi:hypothetical protein
MLTSHRFLIGDCSGPFIKEPDAHGSISLACLAQLLQSVYFAGESPDPTSHQTSISQSFHALLPYAIEYWVEHILAYASSVSPLACFETSTVMRRLLELCNSHKERLQMSGKGDLPVISMGDLTKLDQRLGWFEKFPDAWALLASCIRYKQAVKGVNGRNPVIYSVLVQTSLIGIHRATIGYTRSYSLLRNSRNLPPRCH